MDLYFVRAHPFVASGQRTVFLHDWAHNSQKRSDWITRMRLPYKAVIIIHAAGLATYETNAVNRRERENQINWGAGSKQADMAAGKAYCTVFLRSMLSIVDIYTGRL